MAQETHATNNDRLQTWTRALSTDHHDVHLIVVVKCFSC